MLQGTLAPGQLACLADKVLETAARLRQLAADAAGGDEHELHEAYYHLLFAHNELEKARQALVRATTPPA